MQQNLQQNKGLVKSVFDKVFDKYDFMNDLMSLGIHRLWKKELVQMMNPSEINNLLDVARKKKNVNAVIVNAGKSLPMISAVDAIKENLISNLSKILHKWNIF